MQPDQQRGRTSRHIAGDRLDRRTFSSWPLLIVFAAAFSGLFGLAAVLIDVLMGGSASFSRATAVMMFAAFAGFLVVVGMVRRDMDIMQD